MGTQGTQEARQVDTSRGQVRHADEPTKSEKKTHVYTIYRE